MSNKGRIAAYSFGVLLTVQSNAAWRQKVRIIGPGVNRTIIGSGENNILWQHWTNAGAWTVECWYEKQPHRGGSSGVLDDLGRYQHAKDSNNWIASKVRRYSIGQLGFDDGAGDGDFNDILATASGVTKIALDNVGEIQAIMKNGTEQTSLVLPQDTGIEIYEDLE